MPGYDEPLLVNILGHTAGALIFAIFLVLLFSRRGWSGARGRYLSGAAAALSIVWNLGSLAVLVRPAMPLWERRWIEAVAFSALSLIPAVLLHVSLHGRRRILVAAGYLLSAVAAGMHSWEIGGESASLHFSALRVITVGFLALTALAAVGEAMRSAGRMAASMCLALFAMSFVHFGASHGGQAWQGEAFVHHAGIPLALFLLLQDYRFVLLDAFVRFLANALLAAVLTWAVIQAAFRLFLFEPVAKDPLHEAVLLISVCFFLVGFAWLRNRVQSLLTRALFPHRGLAGLPQRLTTPPILSREDDYIQWAAREIAEAVRTSQTAIEPLDAPRPEWAEAALPIRLGPGAARQILLGRREGGRRYLGADMDALARAAAEIEEKVQTLRRQELDRLVSQAELRALESQINPHFLFNALNALYGTIPRSEAVARRLVLNLAGIFRYFLQTERSLVTVAEEMEIVRAYLEVEQVRLAGRLQVEIAIDEAALAAQIPVLSLQPLVENAIKHGIARRTEPGRVRIESECSESGLRIAVLNSAAASGAPAGGSGLGLGLQNVRRRLEICFGRDASLDVDLSGPEARVELRLPVPVRAAVG